MLPWLTRSGLALDRLLNAFLFDGLDTETVSLHSAEARRDGKRWGCVVCWLLAVLVQRDHCALTLDPTVQETLFASVRALGVMLAILAVPLALYSLFLLHALS